MNRLITSGISTALLSGLLVTAGCGSSGGGSSANTGSNTGGGTGSGVAAVPANAIVLDKQNAEPTVAQSVTTSTTLNIALPSGVETRPTMGLLYALELIKPQLENLKNTAKNSGVDLVYGANVNDSGACDIANASGSGTYSYVGHETSSADNGIATFTNCNFGSGFILNGSISYSGNWNNLTGDYTDTTTGTLTIETQTSGNNPIFSFSGIDYVENGNDLTSGAETYTVTKATFAVNFNGGNGFLVSLTAPIIESVGGYSHCPESGGILITGANGTTAEGIYNGDTLTNPPGTMTIKANGVVVDALATCYY